MKRIISYLLFALAVMGCSNKNELLFADAVFPEIIDLKGEVVEDTFIMGTCYDMEYYNHTLWVVGYIGEEEEDLHVFDANTGRHIKSLYPKGRGTGEAIDVPHINIDKQTGRVTFYDYNVNRIHYFQADSVITHNEIDIYLHSSLDTIGMSQIFLGKENYIGISGVRQPDGKCPRIFLIEHDSIINEYNDLPNIYIPGKNSVRAGYMFANYALHPSKTKLICASIYGATLEIFNIQAKQITLDTIRGFIPPVYSTNKHGHVEILPGETIFGFFDVYATNDFIYTIYCANTDVKKKYQIAVFDWKGNEYRLYKTDYPLECICVDEQSNQLYATTVNQKGEKIIVKFKLPE